MSGAALVATAVSASLAEPPAASALLAAVQWLEGVVLGSIATSVALIAVASVGLMMLAGRVAIRRGGHVLLGCFILFGAQTIARGIQDASTHVTEPEAPVAAQGLPPSPLASPAPRPQGYDPYAGAAVPTR